MEDLWTVMLSDDSTELAKALDCIATDEVASDIAETDLGLSRQRLNSEPKTTRGTDAD